MRCFDISYLVNSSSPLLYFIFWHLLHTHIIIRIRDNQPFSLMAKPQIQIFDIDFGWNHYRLIK